jgi:hypothetical protein
MAELADHAWSHAVAVLGDPGLASEVARTAVRRGGRSRSGVLAHARHEALAVASPPVDPTDEPAPDDLVELARQLAASRPAVERAIVDLDTRHGLDRAGLGRALGLNPADAGTRASEVFLAWERDLDPALLARLGPLRCEGLAELLEGAELWQRPPSEEVEGGAPVTVAVQPATVARLLEVASAVGTHAETCAVCRDRMKSMVSVRSLLGQAPLERAPTEVRGAAWGSRLRRPIPPPPLEPGGHSGPPLWARVVTTIAVLVALVTGGVAVAGNDDGAGEAERVGRLTQLPVGGTALAVQPASIEGATLRPVRLSNTSERTITWRVEASEPWLQVEPSAGDLPPGERTTLALTLGPDAPEGEVRGSFTILGNEGSSTVVRVLTAVENPPDVAATSQGCAVTATVEDEVGVSAVMLQWNEPNASPERTPILAADDGTGYVGYLPPRAVPLTWFVTATDTRGNSARTEPQVLEPGICTM